MADGRRVSRVETRGMVGTSGGTESAAPLAACLSADRNDDSPSQGIRKGQFAPSAPCKPRLRAKSTVEADGKGVCAALLSSSSYTMPCQAL